MKTTIIYFSATGNSLTTAKKVSKYYEECELINVRDYKNITIKSDVLGIVCPVYYGTTAYIMMEFIRNMSFETKPYIFLLTTCKGHTGIIASRINRILEEKGQSLAISRNVVMPGNSWISTKEENEERLKNQDTSIKEVINDILNQKHEEIERNVEFKDTPVDYPNNFRGIMVDENCIGCGICEKVCPMNNIKLVNGKSIIGNECITCLCCFHWCPKEAIYMSKEETVARRFKYHHPDVKVVDFYKKGID